jgi:hypothetical protein
MIIDLSKLLNGSSIFTWWLGPVNLTQGKKCWPAGVDHEKADCLWAAETLSGQFGAVGELIHTALHTASNEALADHCNGLVW